MVTAGPDDAQALKNWQPAICPESDYKQSDFLEDDKRSFFSSPSLIEMHDTKDEGYGQDTIGKHRQFKIFFQRRLRFHWRNGMPFVKKELVCQKYRLLHGW